MTLAFGDLQGCRQPLEQLLKKIGAAPTEPLWFCGDLVNRGPDSLGTLRQIRQLGLRARTVLGNHDLHLLAQYAGIRTPRPGDTLEPILRAPDAPELIDWLRTRPLALRQGDFLMVHAGLLPEWEFEQARDLAHEVEKVLSGPHWQDFLSVMYGNTPDRWSDSLRGDDRLRCIVNGLTRLRYLHTDGHMDFKCTEAPADAPEGLIPWFQAPNRRSAGRPIIFGHWSSLGLRLQPDLIALDTGCVWGGSLTAIRLENRQLFQQPCPGRKRGGKD